MAAKAKANFLIKITPGLVSLGRNRWRKHLHASNRYL
jgi:hypothetical protein